MGWELLTKLLDSSKGRKPTLILRTQLSVRVSAILGECVRASVSSTAPPSPAGSVSFRLVLDSGQGRSGQDMWPLPIPILTSPSRARADATAGLW